MKFTDTKIPGVVIIDSDVFKDDRGVFAVTWASRELEQHGLRTDIVQCNLSQNHGRGTLRGMHYQAAPFDEVKIVRASKGVVFDVAVDLRPDSPTFKQWVGVELDADRHRQMYLPPGCAHGYQTLTEHAEVVYFVSAPYSPPHQRGVRWNDPAFKVEWPIAEPAIMNDRDRTYPDFGR